MSFINWLENKDGENFSDIINEAKKRKKKWIQKADFEKGKFTDYCGGEVTQDCIEKGLASDDPHVVKMASLAKTFRKMGRKKTKKHM